MNLYLVLCKAFLNTQLWNKYNAYLDQQFLKENHPELWRIYNCFETLHRDEEDSKTFTTEDLFLTFKSNYPQSKDELYQPIFHQLNEVQFDLGKVSEYLETIRKRKVANELALTALAVAEGSKGWEDLKEQIALSLTTEDEPAIEDSPFVEDDIDELIEQTHNIEGLRWRLGSLNRNLGSLRKGDFGFLFARPESGKTTFLASEVTHMASQTDRPIIWFNNEEQSGKVLLRCYQAFHGIDNVTVQRRLPEHKESWNQKINKRIRIIKDPTISKRTVEELCRELRPALIIFDQIDKIKGFDADRNDLELKAIYVWAREIAKEFAPVIAVCQAGNSGEGKRWLTMGDVDNSKTGKQGEADWILGIGKVFDDALQDVRYLHLSKNKLLGDHDADEAMRHGKWECKIRPELARYEDF